MKNLIQIQNKIFKSESVSSNSFGELEISGHDSNSLAVDGAEVSIFEQGN